MNSALSDNDEMNDVYASAGRLLFEEGHSEHQARQALIEAGISPEMAIQAGNQLAEQFKMAQREKGLKDMGWGALSLLAGLALTVSDTGFIFYGAIGWGVYKLIDGLIASMS